MVACANQSTTDRYFTAFLLSMYIFFSPGNAGERNYFQCKIYAVISYFLNMKCTGTVGSCYTTAVQHSAEYRYSAIMYGYESFKVNLAMEVVEKDWVIVTSPRYCGLSVLRTPNDGPL